MVIGNEKKNFTPSKFSKICREHFLISDKLNKLKLDGSTKIHLKPDAVHTKYIPYYAYILPKNS